MKRWNNLFTYGLTALLTLFLTGCMSNNDPSFEVSGGGVMAVMDSKDYAAMEQAKADAASNTAYYQAEADKYSNINDPTAMVALAAITALSPHTKNPTNGNDVLIAKSNASVAKVQAYTGLVPSLVGGVVGVAGIDALADLGTAALNRSSTTINADNGSTVSGAIGENNTMTEQVSGILTNPADVGTIALGSEAGVGETIACETLRELIPVEEGSNVDINGAIDTNGDGLVCSNSDGSSVDN